MNTTENKNWGLMASHGLVLFYIAANQESTMREMADALGITERRVARIVKDLADAEMITVERSGRRNLYAVNESASFRHPTLTHLPLRGFVRAVREGLDEARSKERTGVRTMIALGLLFSAELLSQQPWGFGLT